MSASESVPVSIFLRVCLCSCIGVFLCACVYISTRICTCISKRRRYLDAASKLYFRQPWVNRNFVTYRYYVLFATCIKSHISTTTDDCMTLATPLQSSTTGLNNVSIDAAVTTTS